MSAVLARTEAVVICGRCASERSAETGVDCASCGAAYAELAPLELACGWCHTLNPRHLTTRCRSCEGPLPVPAGAHPGAQAPDLPRRMPEQTPALDPRNPLVRWAEGKGWHPVVVVLIGILGFWAGGMARRHHRRCVEAMRYGYAAKARITQVERGPGRTRIHWRYHLLDGSLVDDCCDTTAPYNAERQPGDGLWVVYRKGEDGHVASAVWPPLG